MPPETKTTTPTSPDQTADGGQVLSRRHVLSRLSDERLVTRYQRSGDELALEELIRRYAPLARSLARRYSHTSEPFDDLLQVASVGFIAAASRFEPGRGTHLRSFAVPTMLGELRRHFRDTGWSVRVPRSLQERSKQVQVAVDKLTARTGHSPTTAEVAAELGLSNELVVEAMEARHAYRAESLERPDDGDDAMPGLQAIVGVDEEGFRQVENRVSLRRAMAALPARERMIVELRFRQELSQSEIAALLGISQMHVSRLLRRSLERMAAVLDTPGRAAA